MNIEDVNIEENMQCDLIAVMDFYDRVNRHKSLFLMLLDDILELEGLRAMCIAEYENNKGFLELDIQKMILDDIKEHLSDYGYVIIRKPFAE